MVAHSNKFSAIATIHLMKSIVETMFQIDTGNGVINGQKKRQNFKEDAVTLQYQTEQRGTGNYNENTKKSGKKE